MSRIDAPRPDDRINPNKPDLEIGAGLLTVGVSGGAAYPSMQAAVGDKFGTQVSVRMPPTPCTLLRRC